MRTKSPSRSKGPAGGTPPGRRVLHREAQRKALHEAALVLFEARGFDATTVDAIATHAGTSRRTFFRYFPTKESVLFAGQARRLDDFRARLAPRHEGESVAARLERAVLEMTDVYAADRDEVLAVQRILASSPTLAGLELGFDVGLEQVVAAALAEGPPPRGRRDATVDAGIVVGGLRAALRAWIVGGARGRLRSIAEHALTRLAPVLHVSPNKRSSTPKRKP